MSDVREFFSRWTSLEDERRIRQRRLNERRSRTERRSEIRFGQSSSERRVHQDRRDWQERRRLIWLFSETLH